MSNMHTQEYNFAYVPYIYDMQENNFPEKYYSVICNYGKSCIIHSVVDCVF